MTVTALDGRRRELKAAGPQGVLHAPDRLRDRAGRQPRCRCMAHHFAEIDGKPYRVDDGQVNLGLAVDVEKKDGSRTLMVPGHPRRRSSCPSTASCAAYDALVEKARTNTLTADDLVGAQRHAHQPRRARHDRLGATADERPGHDRRHRLDRLPGRPRQRRRADRRGEGHDDDLDLRPPRHPGRGVRALPGARSRSACRASTTSTRACSQSLGVELGPRRAPPAPDRRRARRAAAQAPRRPTSRCCRPCRPRARSCTASAATGTSPRALTRSAPSPRASRSSTRRQLGLTPQVMAQIPARILRMYVPGRDARRGAAPSAPDLLRDDRL